MNYLKTISLVVGLMQFVLLTGCKNNSSTTDAVDINTKAQDSLQLINLIPEGYTLLDSQLVDLDPDSAKEYVFHFKTTSHTTCDNVEFNNCFLNQLLIVKKVSEHWTETYRFNIQNPLPSDSVNRLYVDFDKSNLLSITSSYRPTCCSSITTTQYFHFYKDNFLMDSLTHSVSTRSGGQSYGWDYMIDVLQQKCKLSSTHFMPEDGTSTESVFALTQITQ